MKILLLASIACANLLAYEVPATAWSFIDSVGINTHFSYTDSIYYTDYTLTKQALSDLGVKHIRDGVHGLGNAPPNLYADLNGLIPLGIQGDYASLASTGAPELADFVTGVHNVQSMENQNEPDYEIGPGWLPIIQAQMSFMAVQGPMYGIPILAPSLVFCPASFNDLGDVSAQIAYTNIHPYPSGAMPEVRGALSPLDVYYACAQILGPGLPEWATETGYFTDPGAGGGWIDSAGYTTYLNRLLLYYFNYGIGKTFLYELADDPSTPVPSGLLTNTGVRRPMFNTMANLLNLLSDVSTAFTPVGLNFTLGGSITNIQHTLLQKHDGTYWLALWQAVSVWNTSLLTPIAAPDVTVNLNWVGASRGYEAYRFNSDGTVTDGGAQSGQAVTLSVGPTVTLVRIGIAGQTGAHGSVVTKSRFIGSTRIF